MRIQLRGKLSNLACCRASAFGIPRKRWPAKFAAALNWLLLIAVLLLVAIFKSSSALAAAYGVAVTVTMITTSLMAFFVFRQLWKWPMWQVAPARPPPIHRDRVLRGQRHKNLRRCVGTARNSGRPYACDADLDKGIGDPQCGITASLEKRHSPGWWKR